MPKILRYAARSDVGKIRSKNDDSAYVGQHLAVVADGMGGHAGGDVASASTVLDLIHLDREGYAGDAGTVLADEIQTANSLLSELVHDNPKLAGMGTTVTALLLAEDKIQFAHIGDSRAYRLKDGVFEQISVDHTFVQRLIDEGRLRPEEAETHPHKNVLMRVLGDVDASPELDLASFEASAGERWLLCSDGLNAVVPTATVEDVLRNTSDIRQCVERLVEMTLDGGSPDNVTVAVVEVADATGDDVRTDALAVVEPRTGATPTSLRAVPAAAGAAAAPSAAGASAAAPSGSAPAADGNDNADASAEAEGGENLGGHLVAAVLREELASRPHELVGAAATAAEAGSIPAVAGRAASRRAATVLTHKTASRRHEPEDDALLSLPRKGRPWIRVAVAAVLLVALVAGGVIGYAWTQSRYYVGVSEGRVAIFNGVSQNLGPIPLSHLQSTTDIAVSSLSEFSQQRVQQTVPAGSLTDAQQIVKNLQSDTGPAGCPTPSSSPGSTASSKPSTSPSVRSTAKASSKPTAKPSASPSAKASAQAAATPSALPSPTSSASPCAGGTP